MAYTVTELITKAYYLSNVVARDEETVSGSQLSDGLDMLNALLSSFATDTNYIPYFSSTDITPVTGQGEYTVTGLVEVENFTFFIGTANQVRYPSYEQTRNEFFGTARAENVNALPFQWHFERIKGGGKIYVYFPPTGVNNMRVWGKFLLTDVSLNQDLSLTYDLFYIDFLRYSLADYICNEYAINLQPQTLQRLRIYQEKMITLSPVDFRLQKVSTLSRSAGINYADVNWGKGWRPPG